MSNQAWLSTRYLVKIDIKDNYDPSYNQIASIIFKEDYNLAMIKLLIIIKGD